MSKVYIIGTGPGDEELLTVKAVKCLKKCTAVLYDRLVSNNILNYLNDDCVIYYCGKEPGAHYKTQEEINSMLVKLAKEGHTVGRVKGGDPYVFGRGGEEVLALKDENIEFEQDEKWQEWLITHGHREEMYEVYYRHTFFSLVADFCSYMLESINCAAKMKVAVSYALLRKPLKDTLGYIEWLRVDRNGMLDLLASGKPEDLVITKEKAREHTSLIEENCKMSSFFDFRYNKASETSLEHIWNNANHLITTKYKLSKTEPGNLNFIFADEAILRSFSDYYYITVPAIMSYAVNLICEMFEEIAPLNKYTVLMNKLNRTLRSFEMLETISFDDAKKLYSSGNVPIVCPRCGLKMKMTDKKMLKFISNKCTCSRCLKTIKTGRYIFDWEKVDFVFNE